MTERMQKMGVKLSDGIRLTSGQMFDYRQPHKFTPIRDDIAVAL